MVAKTITIDVSLAGGTEVPLPEYAGKTLVILRGGVPFAPSKFEVLSTGGFRLISAGDKLVLNELFAIFPQPVLSNGMVSGGFGVSQYPHVMTLAPLASSTMDENGDWQTTEAATTELNCRYEVNTKNSFIVGADGTRIDYAGVVYIPLPVDELKNGTSLMIVNQESEIVAKGIIKKFSRGQLNARVWL
jgi:hypothetical protein